jgi:hypothetical protein
VAWLRSVPSSVWLIVALLLATAARLPALGQQSLWIDEGNTYIRMILPLFDRVRRFDPYTLGQLEIGSWLVDHAEYVRHEWFLKGVYLALLDPDGCSGGTLPEDGGRP